MKRNKLEKKIDKLMGYTGARLAVFGALIGLLISPVCSSAISTSGYTTKLERTPLQTAYMTDIIKATTSEAMENTNYQPMEGMGGVNFYLTDTRFLSDTEPINVCFQYLESGDYMYVEFPAGEISCTYDMNPGTYEFVSADGGDGLSAENYHITSDTFIVMKDECVDVNVDGCTQEEWEKQQKESGEQTVTFDDNEEEVVENETSEDSSFLENVLAFLKKNFMNIIMVGVCVALVMLIKKRD